MAKSSRPDHRQSLAVFTLVEECCDLWASPAAWKAHLASGIRGLIDAPFAQVQRIVPTPGNPRRPHIEPIAAAGLDSSAARTVYFATVGAGAQVEMPRIDAAIERFVRAGAAEFTRRDVVPDSEWYRSDFYRLFVRSIGFDDFAVAMRAGDPETGIFMIGGSRGARERRFGEREVCVLSLLADAVRARLGVRLCLSSHVNSDGLPARCREALDHLLDGLGEKQIAAAMGIGMPTAHQHITRVYRHFGVSGRAELMAHFVRRRVVDPPGPRG